MNADILILITNYYNEYETSDYILSQLLNQTFNKLEIVIVNNGSENIEMLNALTREHSNIFLLNPQKNLGYLGGAFYGLETYLKDKKWFPKAVVVTNTDLQFEQTDFIEKIHQKYLASENEIGMIGPAIYSTSTGANQNPFYKERIRRSKLLFLEIIFSNYVLYIFYETISLFKRRFWGRHNKVGRNSGKQFVYAVHGSFIILTQKFFSSGGTLQYDSFLYGEEIFLAEQARRLNLKVAYDGSLKIIHEEHSTTSVIKNKMLVKYMLGSVKYLLKNFF